jgi:hypothetical protein
MKAGVVYPQIELGGDVGAVKAFAQAAEDLGFICCCRPRRLAASNSCCRARRASAASRFF